MSDLIKRADAIEAIFKVGHEHVEEKVIPLGAVTDYSDAIKALPSVQVSGDLISRSDAKQQISEWATIITNPTLLDKDATMVVLDSLPSAEGQEVYRAEIVAEALSDAYDRGFEDAKRAYEVELARSAEAVQGEWIPFTRRPMTEEEQKDYPNCTFIFDCVLPDDGDEILVSNGRFVWMDTFCSDIDGCYLDGGDDIDEDMAWMPLPTPYKGGDTE